MSGVECTCNETGWLDCPVHEFDTGCGNDCPDDCMADHRGEQ